MSELIFPSEALPDINWENPLADNVLTLQIDDGATVTNCLTGGTGEVFDTANEIGTTKLSVTWIVPLTAGEAIEINSNPYQLCKTAETASQEYGLVLSVAGHTVSFPFVGAFTGVVTYSDGSVAPISGIGAYVLDGTTPVTIVKVTTTDTVTSYNWEFNQTGGTQVIDHTNGAIATLVGFPADSGYIRGGLYGEIVGYQFGGSTTATLVLTGAYTGTITYTDSSTLAISGVGNYVVDSSHVKAIASIVVTDTLASFNYDCTSGDQYNIIETINGNDATITGDSVVGFQPILPVRSYTVGVGKDYLSLPTAMNSNKNIPYTHLKFRIYGRLVSGDIYAELSTTGMVEICAGDNPWNLHDKDTCDSFESKIRNWTGYGNYVVRDVRYSGSFVDNVSLNIKIYNTLMDGNGTSVNCGQLTKVDTRAELHGCVLTGYYQYQAAFQNMTKDRQFFYDCIWVKNNITTSNSSWGIAGNSTVINGIMHDNGVGKTASSVSIINNVLTDTVLQGSAITDSQTGVDFTGAFFDLVSDDFRINQAWADTNLTGTGWNGSNIVEWDWATAAGGGGITVTIDNGTYNLSGTAITLEAWVVQPDGSNDNMSSATLGDVTASKLRVVCEHVTWATTGYLWAQAGVTGGTREAGLYIQSGKYTAYAAGFAQILGDVRSGSDQTHDLTIDYISNTILYIVDAFTVFSGSIPETVNRLDGELFRFFGRNGGYYVPPGTRLGNTQVYINDILVRNYDFDNSFHGAGTVLVTETVGGNDADGVNMVTDGSVWVDLGGGGGGAAGGITVTIDNGTYNLSGSAIALKAAFNNTAQSGSYLLSGSQVALNSAYNTAIDNTPYNLSGSEIALKAAFNTIVQSGTYSLTGSAIGLNGGASLIADSGTYSLTGSGINLAVARKSLIESGSYNLTGSGVTLIYTPAIPGDSITLDSGVFSLTGSDIAITVARFITPENGDYSLTGNDVSLRYGTKFIVDSGAYELTGQSLNFVGNYGIITQSVEYNLTGTNVTLIFSGGVTQIIGTVTAGYAENTTSAQYKINSITVNFKG